MHGAERDALERRRRIVHVEGRAVGDGGRVGWAAVARVVISLRARLAVSTRSERGIRYEAQVLSSIAELATYGVTAHIDEELAVAWAEFDPAMVGLVVRLCQQCKIEYIFTPTDAMTAS